MQHVGRSTTQRRQNVWHNTTEHEAQTKCDYTKKGDPLRPDSISTWSFLFTGKKRVYQGHKKNHVTTWPGLDEKLIENHLHRSMAIEAGHLTQEHQQLKSTSTNKNLQEIAQKMTTDVPQGQPFKKILEEDIHT